MSFNHEDYSLEELLVPVYHALTTGADMTAANFAFQLLCDKLGKDPDDFPEFNPKWAQRGTS
jgi:hypothetical protein